MIAYFTGTGNSRYCAKALADHLHDECMDLFPYIRGSRVLEIFSTQPWVFVTPTYSWQLPHVVAELIRRSCFSGSRDVYFVMTCGSDIGNAAVYNQRLCEEKNLQYRGTLPVIMPENYIAMFSAPEQDEAVKIISAARPVVEQGAAWIQNGRDFPSFNPGLLDRMKSGLVNRAFYRFQIRTSPFAVSEACVSCGQCEKACPMGNIQIPKGRPVWGHRCTHCMACICRCPVQAIEYGKISRGKIRYQCPEYRNSGSE